MVSTNRLSTSRLSAVRSAVCSAFATADSISFLMIGADFLSANARTSMAWGTSLPRTRSATRRALRAETRMNRAMALLSMAVSLLDLRLAVGRVAPEGAGRRELSELVADHLLGHVHGDELPAVV